MLPFQIVVHFQLIRLQAVAQLFQLLLHGIEFARRVFLMVARFLIALQHFLIAEHVEHQVQ